MFHRTPSRPLQPTVGNTVGITTRFSGHYPIKMPAGGCLCQQESNTDFPPPSNIVFSSNKNRLLRYAETFPHVPTTRSSQHRCGDALAAIACASCPMRLVPLRNMPSSSIFGCLHRSKSLFLLRPSCTPTYLGPAWMKRLQDD